MDRCKNRLGVYASFLLDQCDHSFALQLAFLGLRVDDVTPVTAFILKFNDDFLRVPSFLQVHDVCVRVLEGFQDVSALFFAAKTPDVPGGYLQDSRFIKLEFRVDDLL